MTLNNCRTFKVETYKMGTPFCPSECIVKSRDFFKLGYWTAIAGLSLGTSIVIPSPIACAIDPPQGRVVDCDVVDSLPHDNPAYCRIKH